MTVAAPPIRAVWWNGVAALTRSRFAPQWTLARQYLTASLLVVLAGVIVTGAWIGHQIETSVLDLGEILAEICDRRFDPEMAAARPGEVARIAIDSARASEALGWSARTALRDGLRATAASFAGIEATPR